MTRRDERNGAEAIVFELPEGNEFRGMTCVVRHQDTGVGEGGCERPATIMVYGLPFCTEHGTEARVGALEEIYRDAGEFLDRFDSGEVPALDNPEALRAIWAAASQVGAGQRAAEQATEEALRRAYPYREEHTDIEALRFDYEHAGGPYPAEWYHEDRTLIHKLMRLAYQEGADFLVKALEPHRESASAQLAYALADSEARTGRMVH